MGQLATDSLLWIKGELDVVFMHARQGLEIYVENHGDRHALSECVRALHQAQGTLRIVEVWGAFLLAEEMEAVAKGIYDGTVDGTDTAFEALMRGILQLPDYLEQVINARHDMPLTLLSLINDLRDSRKAVPLSESELFSYTLDETRKKLPALPRGDDAGTGNLQALARKLRPKFQTGLLAWFKSATAKRPIKRMMAVVNHLERAAGQPGVFELWWIVGGVLEALYDGGVKPSDDIKKALGQIDRQIKRHIDETEAAFADDPPRELINMLLYYVGRSRSNGTRVSNIKQSFSLADILPDEAQLDEARAALSGPNAQLIRTVSAAIKEDVIQVKDSLDIFVRTGQKDTDELAPLAELLKKVCDTLATLGLDVIRSEIEGDVDTLNAMACGQRAVEDAPLMSVAQSLLSLESRLDGDISTLMAGGSVQHDARGGDNDDNREYHDTFAAVIQESIVNLARIKDVLTQYSRGDVNGDATNEVPGQLSQVQAGLRMLEMERPADVLGSIRLYVEQKVRATDKRPTAESLERMADALVSVEFYLETVQSGRGDPQSMLDNAETCVAQLGIVPSTNGGPNLSLVDTSADAIQAEGSPAADVDDTIVAPPTSPMGASAPSESAAQTGVSKTPLPEEVDPEILDIFLEEAREELASLRDHVPRWQRNLSDHEALAVVRRSFHTLKGSGRMVGAQRIGEFSWAIENMLNRVLDRTIDANDTIVELVADVIDVLPELVDELEKGAPSNTNIDGLVYAAECFSRGDKPDSDRLEALENAQPGAGVVAADAQQNSSVGAAEPDTAADDDGLAMDPALYDIFSKESSAHVEVIDAFVRELEKGKRPAIDDALLRALHTLKGSAYMASATAVSNLAEPTERYLQALAAQQESVRSSNIPVLRNTVTAITSLIEQLGGAASGVTDFSRLQASLVRLAEDVADNGYASVSPAATQPGPTPQTQRLSDAEDFDPELAAIFFEEARELIENIDQAMERWSEHHHDDAVIAELQRHLHTFKGGARMAGLMPLGDLSHELESLLTPVSAGHIEISSRLVLLVQQVVDRLHQMLESAINGAFPQPAGDLLKKMAWFRNPVGEEPAISNEPAPAGDLKASSADATDTADKSAVQELGASQPSATRDNGNHLKPEMMRVRADLLDAALDHAGEVGIYRSRLEQQTSTMNFNVAEFDSTVTRLREQLRKFEIETEAQIGFQHEKDGDDTERGDFDPLELDRYSQLQQLSRSLMESVGDLVSLHSLLEDQSREAETLLLQQSRVTTELQDSLMRTRMVPFSRHSQRLRRVVRQTAQENDKKAELKLSGADGEMDRQVLERVLAPLEHMLRNSVVHGIETPQKRAAAGKPETGQVHINLQREGSEVVITITDDGAGLNIDAIREQALARGLVGADVSLADSDIMQFIFETGFSTAKSVSKSAGRGVGMDVVASEVKQLGGVIKTASVKDRGSRFTIRLPFTLAITQGLLISAGDDTFAVPLPTIEGIARIPGRDLNRYFAGELTEFSYGGRAYDLHHLSSLIGKSVPEAEEGRTTYPVLLVHSGEDFGALVVESMRGSREMVVKSLGPQLSSIAGLSGATIQGDGNILLILDPVALLRRPDRALLETTVIDHPAIAVDNRKIVMVVDDSITVRRVTQRLLERYDMRVETAKDGVDALTQLQDITPDVMLLDIEMPRMDGYELAANIRNEDRLKDIPIIMITSRTGDKHRKRAMEIGVNEYLGKPYQEADLLEHIERLTGAAAA